jgi:exodeoxyribonuclease VIII
MIDIECLGLEPGYVILSIGAVRFNLMQGIVGQTFYRKLHPVLQEERGAKVSVSTAVWWMGQSKEAQIAAICSAEDPAIVLSDLATFIGDPKTAQVWGNGPDIDCAMVANLYSRFGMQRPWQYYNQRCFRTIAAHYAAIPKDERQGTYHNALDDAMYQVKHLMKIRSVKLGLAV